MITSTAVSSATGTSTARPSQPSSRPALEANGEAGAASPVCTISMAGAGRRAPPCPHDLQGGPARPFRVLAAFLPQPAPPPLPFFPPPLLVEAGGFQLGAERLLVDGDELHALGCEVLLEGRILLGDVL